MAWNPFVCVLYAFCNIIRLKTGNVHRIVTKFFRFNFFPPLLPSYSFAQCSLHVSAAFLCCQWFIFHWLTTLVFPVSVGFLCHCQRKENDVPVCFSCLAPIPVAFFLPVWPVNRQHRWHIRPMASWQQRQCWTENAKRKKATRRTLHADDYQCECVGVCMFVCVERFLLSSRAIAHKPSATRAQFFPPASFAKIFFSELLCPSIQTLWSARTRRKLLIAALGMATIFKQIPAPIQRRNTRGR